MLEIPPQAGDLADHGEALSSAVADPGIEIVAVVFNAVDDEIGSTNTGAVGAVRAEEITGFIPTLCDALDSGRRVVVTADHGHTPFWGKELRVGDGSTPRYRELAVTEAASAGFIEIDEEGQGGGPGRKAYAWKMGGYLGQLQRGFHGGCSLEEMVVPLAELVRGGVAADEPAWWYGAVADTAVGGPSVNAAEPPKATATPGVAPTPAPPTRVQGNLFDPETLTVTMVDQRLGLPAALRAQLDRSELAALAVVFANQSVRVSDIAKALQRPPLRTPGLQDRPRDVSFTSTSAMGWGRRQRPSAPSCVARRA